MRKFIELTTIHGDKILLNIDYFHSVIELKNSDGFFCCEVYFYTTDYNKNSMWNKVQVKEDYATIKKLLAKKIIVNN